MFEKASMHHDIEHRPIPPRRPQTNGMVERFNGRISDVLATTRFDSAENLEQTLMRYGHLYNQHIPQRTLGHKTPVETLKDWKKRNPNFFANRSGIMRDRTPTYTSPVLFFASKGFQDDAGFIFRASYNPWPTGEPARIDQAGFPCLVAGDLPEIRGVSPLPHFPG